MTVADLIDALKKMPKDAKIVVYYETNLYGGESLTILGEATEIDLHEEYYDDEAKKHVDAVGIYHR